MRTETRLAFNTYLARVEQLNPGVDIRSKFNVDPSVQQTLEVKTQESSAFLSMINIIGVPELKGEKVGLGVNSTIAGRTDTAGGNRRNPRSPQGTSPTGYELKQTNFDTFISYALLDAWAKFPEFQTLLQGAFMERAALDRIMIGWNGTSAAAATDRVANPLLQDVNIGWLQDMRTNNAARVMSEGVEGSNKIRIGQGGDYKTLDALVMDAKHSLLPSWQRNRTDMVAICGSNLLHDKYFRLVNQDEKPTEQVARDIILSTRRLGGEQAGVVPYFPEASVFLTPLKNLSIYYQDEKRRRLIKDEPEYDRVADYSSSNEGFVIEDYEQAILLENIELIDVDEG